MRAIGLGITTFNRPRLFEQSVLSIIDNLNDELDYLVIYNDGSDEKYRERYEKIYESLTSNYIDIKIIHNEKNQGVAFSKNRILEYLIDQNCDYFFLGEDDIIVLNNMAIKGYIKVAQKTGIHHLNFGEHGKLNQQYLLIDPPLVYWPNCVGAWSFYTKECLNKVGLFDENFYNAWEHVEHTKRIAKAGLTSPFWYFADAHKSSQWLREHPKGIQTSNIRNNPDWAKFIEEGLSYWEKKDGEGLPEALKTNLSKPWKW